MENGFPVVGPVSLRRPAIIPPPPQRLPAKKWRDLIRQVWHTDPLRCPKCRSAMRVIAVIDDPRIVEKILRHLGAWSDPTAHPQARPPPTNLGPCTYEPYDDVDSMPQCPTMKTY